MNTLTLRVIKCIVERMMVIMIMRWLGGVDPGEEGQGTFSSSHVIATPNRIVLSRLLLSATERCGCA